MGASDKRGANLKLSEDSNASDLTRKSTTSNQIMNTESPARV